jgi:protein ImuA
MLTNLKISDQISLAHSGFDSRGVLRFVHGMFLFSPSFQPRLPDAVLAGSAVHELRAPAGTAVHTGFAILLLADLAPDVPVVWVSPSPGWYPPGLAWLGLDPARCLFAQADDDATCLGTLEVALRGGMAGVAECKTLSRLAARRLALAAKQGGSTGLLLRHAPAFTREDSTAFATRWMISPTPGGGLRAELLYAKGAQPRVYLFEMKEEQNGATPPALTPLRWAG